MSLTPRPLVRFISTVTNIYVALFLAYLLMRTAIGDRHWTISLVNTFSHLLFLPLIVLLPLALLFRARLPALRLLPVAAVGALWFGPYFLPKAEASTGGPTLSVMTFNIWGRNRYLADLADYLRGVNADVVLLQEVPQDYAAEELPRLQADYPYQFAPYDDSGWAGVVILSRYPIRESQVVDLGLQKGRPQTRAVLDVQGQLVAVYGVHLSWPVSDMRFALPGDSYILRVLLGYDDRKRNQEVEALLRHLQSEPYPFIVGGDFNTSDQSPTYQQLAGQLRDSFREVGRGFGASWPVSPVRDLLPWLPPVIRIDYLWHSPSLRALSAWRGQPAGSDHLPMLAVLELPRP
ncbi:MAG: endonuclease/exonuclease/phosphatase family protein [Anaerolineae bacterium]|nr:endonuclease/exonuclease/phosphatase family protein [Anaerolineae bacterium]